MRRRSTKISGARQNRRAKPKEKNIDRKIHEEETMSK